LKEKVKQRMDTIDNWIVGESLWWDRDPLISRVTDTVETKQMVLKNEKGEEQKGKKKRRKSRIERKRRRDRRRVRKRERRRRR